MHTEFWHGTLLENGLWEDRGDGRIIVRRIIDTEVEGLAGG
jgi:hypothetical protein